MTNKEISDLILRSPSSESFIQTLRNLGISTVNQDGEFRNFFDILRELSQL